ncbi:MAG: aldo/keto reductase [Oliverpabstia sp.]
MPYGINLEKESWAPFAEGREGIFQNETLDSIGRKYGKTPAQVILRWLRQKKIIAIPKSIHAERIRQNFAIDDFSLTDSDIREIEKMDSHKSLILEIRSLDEIYRLHGIHFEQ